MVRLASLTALVLLAVIPAASHDLYLVTGVPGAAQLVCARIGEHFPESMNGITADRVELFRVHRPAAAETLTGKAEPKQFCAALPKDAAFVEMVVRPRFIKLAAKDFNSYIRGEGFKEVIRLREQLGQSSSEGRELYSRYAKLLVGAGDHAMRTLGHELEIVPEKDPGKVKAGASLPVRILFRGKPLAGVQVSAVYAGAELKGHEYPVTVETDAQGRAEMRIDRPGLWYIRLIHMIPAESEKDADWRSFFATLTFTVAG